MESSTASLPVIRLTDTIANYMNKKFRAIVDKDPTPIHIPREWSLQLLIDCDLAATVIAEAFGNRIATVWSVDKYAAELSPRNNGQNISVEERLKMKFPPIYEGMELHEAPLMITDVDGKAFTWYLPGILSTFRKNFMWRALKEIEPELQVIQRSTQWRAGPMNFRGSPNHQLKAGTTHLAPAWFEQGHDTPKYLMKVSRPLVAAEGPASRWLAAMMESSALIGGILSIIQPDVYQAGIRSLIRLHADPTKVTLPNRLLEVLQLWTAPFHGLAVISNRVTPVHRDANGGQQWMDILVALGTYQQGTLELPGIHVKLQYDPGTVVAIAGRVIAHSAECNGDRACIAYYMREKVNNRLGLASPGWFQPEEI